MAEGEGQWAQGTGGRQWRVDRRGGQWQPRVRLADGQEKVGRLYDDKESAFRWARRRAGSDRNPSHAKEPSYLWHYGAE